MKIYVLIISAMLFATNIRSQSCNALPVPFHEGFQSVTANSQWPACWSATLGTIFTWVGGPNGSFASVSSGSNNYFNSPEFLLSAGYSYSVSMHFRQTVEGNFWNLVALHLVKGNNQNLGIVASGTSFTTADSLIHGTFSVSASGAYHLGFQALKASGASPSMSVFDDIRVTCANNMHITYPVAICAGESVELYGSGATSYTFQTPSQVVVGMPYIDSPLADETYTVYGTIYGNCIDTHTIGIKVDECLGIKENRINTNFYPNPFNEHFTIETELASGTVTIYDMQGTQVYTAAITNISSDIVVKDLGPGIYVLKYQEGTRQSVMKLIRQ